MHIPYYLVIPSEGIKNWWKRFKCRFYHGGHKFKGTPTKLYYVTCENGCGAKKVVFFPPMPPAIGETAQECPHCHNVAYSNRDIEKDFYCVDCHRTSKEGDGRVLVIPDVYR